MRPAKLLTLLAGLAVAAPVANPNAEPASEPSTDIMISTRDLAVASTELEKRQLDFGAILQFLPIILEGVANGSIPISFVIELIGNLIKGNVQTDIPIGLLIDLAVTLIKLIEGQTKKADLTQIFGVVGQVQKAGLSGIDVGNLVEIVKNLIAGGEVDLGAIIAFISQIIGGLKV